MPISDSKRSALSKCRLSFLKGRKPYRLILNPSRGVYLFSFAPSELSAKFSPTFKLYSLTYRIPINQLSILFIGNSCLTYHIAYLCTWSQCSVQVLKFIIGNYVHYFMVGKAYRHQVIEYTNACNVNCAMACSDQKTLFACNCMVFHNFTNINTPNSE